MKSISQPLILLIICKNIKKDFISDEYEYYMWSLSDVIIKKGESNDNLKFDLISPNKDEYPMHFNGFLYPDGTFNGKAKYFAELNIRDSHLKGIYTRNSKNYILIKGIWESPDGSNEGFWIEIQ